MATPVQRVNLINSFLAEAEVDEWTAELFLDNSGWDVSEALCSFNDTKERYELLLPDSVYYRFRDSYSDDQPPSDLDDDDPFVIPYGTVKIEEAKSVDEKESEANEENEEIGSETESVYDENACDVADHQQISHRSELVA